LVASAEFLATLDAAAAAAAGGGASGGGAGGDDEEEDKKDKEGKNPHMKPEVDDSHLTPEQRAKAEAKRKLKAEKAAQKNAAKEAKKSGGKAVALGMGTASVRRAVSQFGAAPGAGGDSTSTGAVQPFDATETGFAAFCVKLLDQLGSGGEKRRPKIAKVCVSLN